LDKTIKVITGNESWVIQYGNETKQKEHTMEILRLTPPQESADVKIKSHDNLCFFDCKGIVQREFVPPGETVNQKFYLQVLERLRQQVHCVRPELYADKWILHHDNAPSHTALSVKEFLEKNQLWSWNTPFTNQISLYVTASPSLS
jgi:hypothetical protein